MYANLEIDAINNANCYFWHVICRIGDTETAAVFVTKSLNKMMRILRRKFESVTTSLLVTVKSNIKRWAYQAYTLFKDTDPRG